MPTLICQECGSQDVWVDAKFYPNDGSTETFDQEYCEPCGGETHLVEKLPEPEEINYA